jgi:hypothetical protein
MQSTVTILLCSVALCGTLLWNDTVLADCCDCAPTASDQQCFMQCNAVLPRCRPAAPRKTVQPGNGQSNVEMVYRCEKWRATTDDVPHPPLYCRWVWVPK